MKWLFASLGEKSRKASIGNDLILSLVVASAATVSACTADLLPEEKRPNAISTDDGPVVPWRTDDISNAPGDDPSVTDATVDGGTSLPDSDDAGAVGPLDAGPTALRDAAIALPASPDGAPGETPSGPGSPQTEPPPLSTMTFDDCITGIEAGEQTYVCGALNFLVQVDPRCMRAGCGLIVDAHASAMSARQMRDATGLHVIAASAGYLIVHPSPAQVDSPGTWDSDQYPQVLDFMLRMQRVFQVDDKRVHVSGFGAGADLALWFACSHPELLSSVASISSVEPSAECFTRAWQPQVPLLYAHGALDAVSPIEPARMMVDSIVAQLELTGGEQVAGDALFLHRHWSASSGMALEFIEHQYTRAIVGGFCIPGAMDTVIDAPGTVAIGFGCTTPVSGASWGQAMLDWFVAHPR
jgi:hypothetical protein